MLGTVFFLLSIAGESEEEEHHDQEEDEKAAEGELIERVNGVNDVKTWKSRARACT